MTVLETAEWTRTAVDLLRTAPAAAVEVFTCLLIRGPMSRVDIARSTGLSQGGVTRAAAPLIAGGLVADDQRGHSGGQPGRPASPLRVVPDALLTLGIKINGDELVAVATDLLTRTRARAVEPLENTALETVLAGVEAVVVQLSDALGSDAERLIGVGVAVSGDVDSHHGYLRESALMGWRAVELGALIEERIGLPVTIENDVRALTVGEHWFGVGVGTASFAIVTIGRGIGCGLHLNGEVIEGAYGVAGEIGHLPLTSRDRICTCGRRGCVEAVASTDAIVAEIGRRHGAALSTESAFELARSGDIAAREVVGEAARVVGTAIATMANLTGPELILIGGEGVRDFDLFDEDLRAAFSEHAFGAAGNSRLVVKEHTFEDWARGASASIIRRLVGGSRGR